MKVERLYGRFKEKTAWIIGTGPSLRMFQWDGFFTHRITIGLNNAHKTIACLYNLTIHPELIPEECVDLDNWITKRKGEKGSWSSRLEENDPNVYVFQNNKELHDYTPLTSSDNRLYCGRGIQATAMCLAAKMGCKTAILVGCDMNSLGGDHHAHKQHVRRHGLSPQDIYDEYYECSAIVRDKLTSHYGIRFYTLSPFLGLGRENEDYERLKKFHDLGGFPEPEDTSRYVRERDYDES